MNYILLAAYNEAQNLPELFKDFRNQNWNFEYKVILVNDGSTDDTKKIIEGFQSSLPVILINHEKNKGLGQALLTGFSYLNGKLRDNDTVTALDADNTHPADRITQMLEKNAAGADIIIASRYCGNTEQLGLALHRKMLSFCASTLLRLVWGIKGVRDYSCGYRMYSGRILNKLFRKYGNRLIEEKGVASTLELLLKASTVGDKFAEIPFTLRYDKKLGKSKMRIFRTIFRYFALMWNIKR